MAHPHHETHAEKREKALAMVGRTGHHMARGGHTDAAADAHMIAEGVHEHERAMHKGQPLTKMHFKAGGAVDGHAAHHHLGRRARGGHTGKKSTHVNVIVAPQGGGMHPVAPAMAAAPPPRPMPAPPPVAPRPPMAAAPPGAGMMPPGGGMRPPGMKRGGGVKKIVEAGTPSENLLQAKRGGHIAHRQYGGPGGTPMAGQQTGPSPQQIQAARALMAQRAAQRTGAAMPAQGMQTMPTQHRGGRTKRKEGGPVHMEAGAGGGEGRIEKMHEYGAGGFKPKEHRGELVRARG